MEIANNYNGKCLILTLNINLSNAYDKINSVNESLKYALDGIKIDNDSYKAH